MKAYSTGLERRFLSALCALIALVGVGSIYWLYTMQSFIDFELQSIDTRLQETHAVAVKLEDAKKRLMSTDSQLRYLEQSVTARSYVPTLLKQLQAAAIQYKLTVDAVRFENPPVVAAPVTASTDKTASPANEEKPAVKLYDEQEIMLSVTGRFWDCMKFLDGLTRFPKIMSVKRVDVRPKTRQYRSDPQLVDMSISVTAFIFRDEAAGK